MACYRDAVKLGCDAARINLAHSYAFVGKSRAIVGELEQLNFSKLSVYDRAFYLRVKSLDDEQNGDLRTALRHVEHAWQLVQGKPEFPLLAPQLLNQLGILHGRVGRSQRALWYLDRNLDLASPDSHQSIVLTRVRILVSLGNVIAAENELRQISPVEGAFSAIAQIRSAELSWYAGDLGKARDAYQLALGSASEFGQTFETFQAALDLALIAAVETRERPTEMLKIAQDNISDKFDRLLYRFREILISCWTGDYSTLHSVNELGVLSLEFASMGSLQEQGWCDYHRANMYLDLNDVELSQSLRRTCKALALSLQNPVLFRREEVLVASFT